MARAVATTITGRLTDSLYVEALLLADETRAYLDGPAAAEVRAAMPATLRVLFGCEALNATTRVMQVLARLLARRAGDDGMAAPVTLPPPPSADTLAALPDEARRLIAAGLDLGERVRRLEAGAVPLLAPASPARALFHRLERSF